MSSEIQSPTFHNQFPAALEVVQSGVASFAGSLRDEASQEPPHVVRAVESYLSILEAGGKRTRGVLTVTGYELYGGSNMQTASAAAGVVEAMHAYLLVVDDVADASDRRRGIPTAHIQLKETFEAANFTGNVAKLGEDVAQTGALFAQHRAQSELLQLTDVPAEHRVTAAELLNVGLARTGLGQALDLIVAQSPDVTIDDILRVATYKTAFYSFLLPLQVGAALAGAPQEDLAFFEDYSLYAGLAFQLQDDVVGLFGAEQVTGKSSMSDIQQGKKTLLMTRALERASTDECRFLREALGSSRLTEEHFGKCLDIIRSCGALEEVRALIESYVQRACTSLDGRANWHPEKVQFLKELAHYGANRAK